MKVELRSIKVYDQMSEETTAFTAEIYVDGKKIGYTKNEGHGGCTDAYPYPEHHSKFNELCSYLESQPDIVYPEDEYPELSLKCNLEHWIDFQISEYLKERENKKLIKHCETAICYKVIGGYARVSWGKYTIKELLNGTVGRETIQKKVNELKSKGFEVLNKNLDGITL